MIISAVEYLRDMEKVRGSIPLSRTKQIIAGREVTTPVFDMILYKYYMFYTIYKITNKETGKFYIGKHQTMNPMDDYFGSGRAIVNAIKLHGKDSFVKEVLHVFPTSEEMDAKEREIITEELVNDPNCYNIGIGGEGGPQFKGKTHSVETKAKISASRLGKTFLTAEGSARIVRAHKGKVVSDETRKKLSEAAKTRKPQDAECKQRISLAMKEFHRQKKYCGDSGDRSVS